MKIFVILFLLAFCVNIYSQREVPLNYSINVRGNTRTDTLKVKTIQYQQGSANQFMLNSDTARYISKSQARKDIHDSIAPLRVDIRTLQSENFLGYYPIPPNDTLKISVGNIFSDDGIFISRFVLKDSLGHKHLGENLNILSDINAIYIDYGKNITNASINFAQSFEIGIDLETIYWVIINRNSYRLFLKYFKNSITNQL